MSSALNVLLKFKSTFVRVFGTVFASDRLQQFSSEIPYSTVAAHKLLWNGNINNFIEYVVCPRCHSIYEFDDCFIVRHGQKESKLCSHVHGLPQPLTMFKTKKLWSHTVEES